MLDIIGKRFWYFLISAIVILAGIVALIVFPLQYGIEFRSGSDITITFEKPVDKQQVGQALKELGYDTAVVQKAGADYILSLPELKDEASKAALRQGLTDKLGKFKDGGFEQVSAKVSEGTRNNTVIAIILSSISMLLYISWAFRRVPNPFRWGTCAIIALVHDIMVALGVFAILGGIFSWRVDLMFVAGMLTVIGYSVNDTIVVFDRIRENLLRGEETDFTKVVNNSLVETFSRSLNTSLTTVFTVVALWLFVGAPVQNLVVVLLAGIVTGTYSSFGTAASLLVVWKNGEWGRFIGKKPVPVAAGR